MNLKEFRKIIDELDDQTTEEYNVVLDIEPSPNGEYLVDIGEIYMSKMHSNQIKIEPVVELDTHKEPMRMDLHADIISRKTELRCPRCEHSVGYHDKFCRKCGQPLYTRDETHEFFAETARARIKAEKEARKAARKGKNK